MRGEADEPNERETHRFASQNSASRKGKKKPLRLLGNVLNKEQLNNKRNHLVQPIRQVIINTETTILLQFYKIERNI